MKKAGCADGHGPAKHILSENTEPKRLRTRLGDTHQQKGE
jgi:hypothetical protein